jgi:hypothetical protein
MAAAAPENQKHFGEYKAPRHSAPEQKMWIQCTLNGAKQRGEDWIESNFSDDETAGCSSCLPDIVVVNDPIPNSHPTRSTGAEGRTIPEVQPESFREISKGFLASKAPAPWQRILTQAEAEKRFENYQLKAQTPDHCCAPTAVCTMPSCQSASTSVPDTYLYDHKRFAAKNSLHKFCVRFDASIFQVFRKASEILRKCLYEQLLYGHVSWKRILREIF